LRGLGVDGRCGIGVGLTVAISAAVATSAAAAPITVSAAVAFAAIWGVSGFAGGGECAFDGGGAVVAVATVAAAAGVTVRVEVGGVAGLFHEVGNIEEGIALEADVHKGGLHAREDAGDFAVIDGACEGVFVLALVIDFGKGVVFDDSET